MKVNANTVNVTVVAGKTNTEATEFHSDLQGHPIRIKAVADGKYILSESDQSSSLQNIHFKRVGKDLHITLEGTDTDQPQLIIEGYFDTQGQLIGITEHGAYVEYMTVSAEQDYTADLLMDSVSSPLSDASQPSSLSTLLAGGINWFWPVLLGLGGLIVGGSTRGSTGGDGTTQTTQTPQPPTTPRLENVEDNVGGKIGNIHSANSTDDKTPTLNGTGEVGSTIYVQYGPSIGSWQDASTSAIVGTDGTWSWTSPAQTKGSWDFCVRSEDAAGNSTDYTSKFILILGSPMITRAVDDMGPNTGDVLNGQRTDDTTLTLYGTADPDATVYIQYGKSTDDWTNAAAPVTANSTGQWSWIAPTLDSGFIWEFRAIIIDADSAGSLYSSKFKVTIGPDITSFNGTDASQTVTLDTIAPDNPSVITTNTNSVNVEYDGRQLSVGDSINLSIGNQRYDYALTQADIDAGMATINMSRQNSSLLLSIT